jgi:hypothetical protein
MLYDGSFNSSRRPTGHCQDASIDHRNSACGPHSDTVLHSFNDRCDLQMGDSHCGGSVVNIRDKRRHCADTASVSFLYSFFRQKLCALAGADWRYHSGSGIDRPSGINVVWLLYLSAITFIAAARTFPRLRSRPSDSREREDHRVSGRTRSNPTYSPREAPGERFSSEEQTLR